MSTEIVPATQYCDAKTDKFKVPPHSIEAEQAVLGGLMIESQAVDRVLDRIQAPDFYRTEHRAIYKAMLQLMERNQPIDVITVSEVLEKHQQLAEVGGLVYLGELANNTPSAANIGAYADIIRERAILRALIIVGTQVTDLAFNPQGRASSEILDQAEQKVFNIAEQGSRSGGPESINHIVARSLDKIETRFQDKNAVTGMATGFNDFDKMTSGLQPGELIIIAGRPSMGKTTFALNIAEHAALSSGKVVLVFSLEMPGESLATRMLSSLGRIELNKLRTGALQEEDWARLNSAVGLMSKAKLYIDESPALSPVELRARARRVARDGEELGLIVVDYLQLMRGSSNSENRTAEISEISRSLKTLAKELNVPVIALSQLNRSLEQRPNKRPVMSDLRESGAIEQDADIITFIYRDEVYHEDSPDKGTAEIIIGKHRNGPIGTFRLTFIGQYTLFANYAHESTYQPME